MSGKRQDIAFTGQYVCIYGEQPGIYAVAVCNTDYPPRVALSMCYEVLTLFKSEAGYAVQTVSLLRGALKIAVCADHHGPLL